MRKYTVNESIWLAAAVYAFSVFKKKTANSEMDLALKASRLRQIAQEISDGEVRDARIHQHTNGDHANCSYRYFRRLEKNEGDPFFRVTATGEFDDDREYPDSLNMDEIVGIDGISYTIGEIKAFIDNEYISLLESFDIGC